MTRDFDDQAADLPELPLGPAAREKHKAAFAAMMSSPPAPPRRYRRRLTILAALGLVTIAAGTGIAASLGAFDAPVTNHDTAHCYTTADLSRADNHNDFGVAVSRDDPRAIGDAAAQAMEICSTQWAIGRFTTLTPTFPAYASGPPNHPVPPLTACVLDNGEVAIFPGPRQVCISLGLANATM